MEILQLLLILVVDVPVVLGRASPQVLPYVASVYGGFLVSAVEIPQVQFLDKVMLFSTLAPLRRLPSPRCTFLLLVLLVTIHLALCSLFVFAPKMLGIMAGMDHKEFSRLFSTSFTCPLCATTGASGARDSAGAVLGQGCPCPCCATTRAHGARDSAGAVLCLLARFVQRHVPMVLRGYGRI